MKIALFKRIGREDLGGASDVPDWVDPLLGAINQQLEPMSIALTGKLTFGDNFSSYSTTQQFTTGVELSINPLNHKARVIGMIPIYAASGVLITSYGFNVKSNGSVGVTLYFANQKDNTAVAAGTKVQATVLLLFG